MTALLALPLAIPVVTAGLLLLFRRWLALQRALGVLSAMAQLGVALLLFGQVRAEGIQVMEVGGWPAPYGIAFAADLLSASMLVCAAFVVLLVSVYAVGSMDRERVAFGFFPLLHVTAMGVAGALLTADAFNLFVWFEVLLIASFALLTLGGERAQLEGGIKYMAVSLVASSLFLMAMGLTYGSLGTLNYAHMGERISAGGSSVPTQALATLFFAAFAIKAALFPFFSWLPASYHTPSPAVSALFAGLLTKVGIYAILRFFTLVFPVAEMSGIFMAIAVLTMLTGSFGAMLQRDVRQALSYLVIASMGFVLVGIALSTQSGLAAAVFYLCQDMLVKTLVFMSTGLLVVLFGSGSLLALRGAYRDRPWLAAVLFVALFASAGLPLTSDFIAKVGMAEAAVEGEAWIALAAMLVSALAGLAAVSRIWTQVWLPVEQDRSEEMQQGWGWTLAPIVVCTLAVFAIGTFATPFLETSDEAADSLLEPESYARAVLGGR